MVIRPYGYYIELKLYEQLIKMIILYLYVIDQKDFKTTWHVDQMVLDHDRSSFGVYIGSRSYRYRLSLWKRHPICDTQQTYARASEQRYYSFSRKSKVM